MLNAILIVGVMVVIANLLVSREFQGYIKANDLERFQIVKESLQEYYSLNGNWDGLLSGPGSLGLILNRSLMMDRQYRQPAIQSPRRRNYLKQRFFSPRERGRKRERLFSTPPPFPDPSSLNLLPNAPKGPGDYFMQRVVLLDNNDNLLLGDLQNEPPELMEEIYHQQTIVGRLGLYPPEMLPHPRDKLFLRTKSTIFWVLAAMMGLSISNRSRTLGAMRAQGVFGVHFLGDWQAGIASRFASDATNKFADVSYRKDGHTVPCLTGCLRSMICRLETEFPGGDHSIVLGRIIELDPIDGDWAAGSPLVFFDRRFHLLGAQAPSVD